MKKRESNLLVTKENVINAIDRIESRNISLRPAKGYALLYNTKQYPPKEVLRFALADSKNLDTDTPPDLPFSGGEPTNKHFTALGFEILNLKSSATQSTKKSPTQENSKTVTPEMSNKYPLNQILYGPPGTGKTYSVKELAVKICEPGLVEDLPSVEENYQERKKKIDETYEELVINGRVVFTTFHQSMSYEDFVEGIKPEVIDDKILYENKNGIFKLLSTRAARPGRAEDDFNIKYKEFLKIISDNDGELELETLKHRKRFLVKVNSNENLYITANTEKASVSLITKENLHNWFYGIKVPYFESYYNAVANYLSKNLNYVPVNKNSQVLPYVLIIDEINRGNVSAIFGELITLIEDTKRAGMEDAVAVTLPYSGDEFSVPPNLYIIGTMNTADRSVEALDTALRRRFSFVEMMPKPELLKGVNISGVDFEKLLRAMNQRIEQLMSRDYTIGHAFFINLKENDMVKLRNKWFNSIMPLLQEYFYGHPERIGWVLGEGFVDTGATEVAFKKLPGNLNSEYEMPELAPIIRIKTEADFKDDDVAFIEALKAIY
jgi:5-methylcytosine-specific restriction protein B